MGKKKSIFKAITWVAVLLPSVFCAFSAVAQTSLYERLNYVLETQDMNMGLNLYQEITDGDIKQLPDSSLFDYHYLGAWINQELYNTEKTIYHLLQAKEISEKSLGVHTARYVDIMRGLGRTYLELEESEKALAIYEDALIKTMANRNSYSHDFGELIIGLQECYENLGWFNEIPNHLSDAWNFWDKDQEPFDLYNVYPLWLLYNYYHRYKEYDKALKINDTILEFISKKEGLEHSTLADMLYFRGCTCNKMGKYSESIEAYNKALSILKLNKLDNNELYEQIEGNLLMCLISIDKLEECDKILSDIKRYSIKSNNLVFYINALYSAADSCKSKGYYSKAIDLNKELQNLEVSSEIKKIVNKQAESIIFNQNVADSLSYLENQFLTLSQNSTEWFEVGYKLSSAYYITRQVDKNKLTLTKLHNAISAYGSYDNEYYLWILDCLYVNSLYTEDFEDALKYAIEMYNYLNSIPNASEENLYYSKNNILVAKLNTNRIEGIDQELESLKLYYKKKYGEISTEYALCLHNIGRAYQLQNRLEEAKHALLKSISIQNKLTESPSDKTLKYYTEVEQKLREL